MTSKGNINSAESEKFDAVLLAVMANRMEAVCREMTNTMLLAARSSVIGMARDFSCAVITSDNEVMAVAEGFPIHTWGTNIQTKSMCDLHPDFKEGDAYLHNDPYDGNSHAADWSIMVPVFFEGVHFFTVTVKGHQADCGDSIPTTYTPKARDVYEEGALIFPCVRIQRNNQDNHDIVRMCKKRIRVPEQWYGDYLSQLGAARIGERRLKAFIGKYGFSITRQFVRDWFDYSEKRALHAFKKLPSGNLINNGKHDPILPFLPHGVDISVEVKIDPKEGNSLSGDVKHHLCISTSELRKHRLEETQLVILDR